MEQISGYARIDELAAGKLFGDYCSRFPNSSRDAGHMLRLAVQIGQVERYQALLELALRERKPVDDEQWHGLCASVSWPRPLAAWDRAPIEQWRLDMNPDATPDWPEAYIGGCRRGPNSPLARSDGDLLRFLRQDREPDPDRPRRSSLAIALRVLAIVICATLLGLALPGSATLDFWVGVAAFIVALVVVATM